MCSRAASRTLITEEEEFPGPLTRLSEWAMLSLRASPTVSVELKFPVELNHFLTPVGSSNQQMKACSESRAGSAKTRNYFHWSINNLSSCEVLHVGFTSS